MEAKSCYDETMETTSTDNLSTLLELTRVAADAAKAALQQHDFFDSNVLQHSVASALYKTVEEFDILMLKGFLVVDGKKADWPEHITLVGAGNQWMGQGQVYTQEDVEAMVQQKCIANATNLIDALETHTLTMEYSIVKGVFGMGKSSPELIQTVSNAIEAHQTQMQHDLLQSATTPAEGRLKSRRI